MEQVVSQLLAAWTNRIDFHNWAAWDHSLHPANTKGRRYTDITSMNSNVTPAGELRARRPSRQDQAHTHAQDYAAQVSPCSSS